MADLTPNEEAQVVALTAGIESLGMSEDEVAIAVVMRACMVAAEAEVPPHRVRHEKELYSQYLHLLFGCEAVHKAAQQLKALSGWARSAG